MTHREDWKALIAAEQLDADGWHQVCKTIIYAACREIAKAEAERDAAIASQHCPYIITSGETHHCALAETTAEEIALLRALVEPARNVAGVMASIGGENGSLLAVPVAMALAAIDEFYEEKEESK